MAFVFSYLYHSLSTSLLLGTVSFCGSCTFIAPNAEITYYSKEPCTNREIYIKAEFCNLVVLIDNEALLF